MAGMLGVLLHDEEQETHCHFTNVAPCCITFMSTFFRNLACVLFSLTDSQFATAGQGVLKNIGFKELLCEFISGVSNIRPLGQNWLN